MIYLDPFVISDNHEHAHKICLANFFVQRWFNTNDEINVDKEKTESIMLMANAQKYLYFNC